MSPQRQQAEGLPCGFAQRGTLRTPWGSREGGSGGTGQGQMGALSPSSRPSVVDGGITVEKEVSKDELLTVIKLYREARGATSDIPRLLKTLSQMERTEVRSDGPAGRRGRVVAEWHLCLCCAAGLGGPQHSRACTPL